MPGVVYIIQAGNKTKLSLNVLQNNVIYEI